MADFNSRAQLFEVLTPPLHCGYDFRSPVMVLSCRRRHDDASLCDIEDLNNWSEVNSLHTLTERIVCNNYIRVRERPSIDFEKLLSREVEYWFESVFL